MTEYELVDAAASYLSLMQAWVATYFTILTAYFVTAFVAGMRLTRSQVSIINVGFVILNSLCSLGAIGTASRFLEFAQQITDMNPTRSFMASPPMIWAISVVLFIGILAALKFMWDVRHPKKE